MHSMKKIMKTVALALVLATACMQQVHAVDLVEMSGCSLIRDISFGGSYAPMLLSFSCIDDTVAVLCTAVEIMFPSGRSVSNT